MWVTHDHKVLTERGWRPAAEIVRGDRLARPRAYSGFGSHEPVSPDHARLLGYLIGDGYAGGKTPIHFTKVVDSLHQEAAPGAPTPGGEVKGTSNSFSTPFSHLHGVKKGEAQSVQY